MLFAMFLQLPGPRSVSASEVRDNLGECVELSTLVCVAQKFQKMSTAAPRIRSPCTSRSVGFRVHLMFPLWPTIQTQTLSLPERSHIVNPPSHGQNDHNCNNHGAIVRRTEYPKYCAVLLRDD